jgi:glutamate---cysteine ligase / carboxylate-amine ligase
MVASGTLIDPGMVYFDARLSERYPTVEIRIADVCLRAEDAMLIAALARALVETEASSWRDGKPAPQTRTEVLHLAAWRASRSGLDDTLLHPVTWKPEPATAVIGMLLDHCREALACLRCGDLIHLRPAPGRCLAFLCRNGRRFCWLEGCPLVSMTVRDGVTGG